MAWTGALEQETLKNASASATKKLPKRTRLSVLTLESVNGF
jgi:hypothetical protein